MTPDEFATWQDDMRSCRGPSEEEIRAEERRKVAEEIAARITGTPKPEEAYWRAWAARIAREIGEARDPR